MLLQFFLFLGSASAQRGSTCLNYGFLPGGHQPLTVTTRTIEDCYAHCVQTTKPRLCQAWAWREEQESEGSARNGRCSLHFNGGDKPKLNRNAVSGGRDCHPYEGRLSQARRLEEASNVPFASSPLFGSLPTEGTLIGMSAYKAVKFGAMAYHMAVWWMDDPTQLAPGNSDALRNQYWTCADHGGATLENARDLSVLNVEGPVNFEVSFSLGPTGASENERNPALNTVAIGKHPSAVFEQIPSYMGYVKKPEGLTLAKFLEVARNVGSSMIEMGGYDIATGKDCQTFTTMMLMQLGLSGLTDVAVSSCINQYGLPIRSDIKKTDPSDVATCSILGTAGNFADRATPSWAFDYDTCRDSCYDPKYSGVSIYGPETYVEIVWCLPNVSRCSSKASACGSPGAPACLTNGEMKCDGDQAQAYGYCVTNSDTPSSIKMNGDNFVAGGPASCPGVFLDGQFYPGGFVPNSP